jgi:hypothetical protein
MKQTIKVSYEYTDTFAGETNYSWVKRGSIELPKDSSETAIVKSVKRELGLTGIKCDRLHYSDQITLKPRNYCQIIFINFEV